MAYTLERVKRVETFSKSLEEEGGNNMRTAFILSFVANLILTVVSLVLGPSRVAIHFGLGGAPNGWAPAYVNALIMAGMNAIVFVSLFFSPRLIRTASARWINIPNKEYWLKEENRNRAESVLSGQMCRFGTVLFAYLFMVGVLALQANLSTPVRLREDLFWWPFGLFMAYVAYWTVNLLRSFRIPKIEIR